MKFKIKSGEIIQRDCDGKIVSKKDILWEMSGESRKDVEKRLNKGCKIMEEIK